MNAPLNPATSAEAVACTGGFTLMLMALLLPFAPLCGATVDHADVKVVSTPAASSSQPLYTGNREPLLPSPLIKLPIGSIKPKGWLRHQLELEAQGMTGRLEEISKWCKFEGNAWADPQGKGHSGWEELPYWLKGYGDLGYVLDDPEIIKSARKWIDAVLASQEADGWFGPRANQDRAQGQARPLAAHGHVQRAAVLLRVHRRRARDPVPDEVLQVAEHAARTRTSAQVTGPRSASATTSRRSTGSTTAPANPGCWTWPSASTTTCRIGPPAFTTGTT